MYKNLVFMFLLYPMLVGAKANAGTTTGLVTNDNGTYSISRFFSPNERESPFTLDKEAEAFCAKRNRHYYLLARDAGTYIWTLTFKCITDKKEAERQKRLQEIPLKGGI